MAEAPPRAPHITNETNKRPLRAAMALSLSALVFAGAGEHSSPSLAQQVEPGASHETPTAVTDLAHLGRIAVVPPPQVTASKRQPMSHLTARIQTLPPLLRRIGGCESNGSPTAPIDYRAENGSTTASGGFQILDSTWNHFRGYRRAMYAPPRIQKWKAKLLFHRHGTSPWLASKPCWD